MSRARFDGQRGSPPFSSTPALVLLVTVGGAVVWGLRRSGDKPLRAYAILSAAFLALSWYPSRA